MPTAVTIDDMCIYTSRRTFMPVDRELGLAPKNNWKLGFYP